MSLGEVAERSGERACDLCTSAATYLYVLESTPWGYLEVLKLCTHHATLIVWTKAGEVINLPAQGDRHGT